MEEMQTVMERKRGLDKIMEEIHEACEKLRLDEIMMEADNAD